MKNSEYWQQRSLELENAAYKDSEEYKKELEKLLKETLNQIQKDIVYWYSRFSKNNRITYAEAQQTLNKNELEEFHWTVDKYIKYCQSETLSYVWRKELENASIKVHVTRLQSLQLQLQQHIEKEYAKRIADINYLLKNGLENDIYKNAYEIEKGLNIGLNLHKYNESEIDDMLKKPWTADGKNFSERLWGRKRQLVADLVEKDLPQALIRGESSDKIINRWTKKLDTDKKAVAKVVQTERAYVNSRAALESYKKLGVKKYQILATLDLKTSNICREMDHKGRNKDEPFFYLDEYKVGLTAPPFHCHCRTTTVPYFNDEFTSDEIRAARDEDGGYKKVPADMTYKEWYKKYVKDNPKALAEEKKIKNKSSDKKQHEEYRKILGSDIPKSFDKFQELKYNDTNKWNELKKTYKEKTSPKVKRDGAVRAKEFSQFWQEASLNDALNRMLPEYEMLEKVDRGKVIYSNKNSNIQMVHDIKGNYFRIEDLNIKGKRRYLDIHGENVANKIENGKQKGRSKEEYEALTHFKNKDGDNNE